MAEIWVESSFARNTVLVSMWVTLVSVMRMMRRDLTHSVLDSSADVGAEAAVRSKMGGGAVMAAVVCVGRGSSAGMGAGTLVGTDIMAVVGAESEAGKVSGAESE